MSCSVCSCDNQSSARTQPKVRADTSQGVTDGSTVIIASQTCLDLGGLCVLHGTPGGNQGELVVPVLRSCTFSNPTFAPYIQQVARMKVKGLVSNFNDPALPPHFRLY